MRDVEDFGSAIVVKVQVPITREVEITSALKFKNFNFRKRKINEFMFDFL
jgi:hypothetical protein